jgi:hypothetical protein
VYDGVFEVLQWLLFLSAVPPVQLLTGWCVTAKAPPDIRYLCSAVKHGNCSSLHRFSTRYAQKIIDMAMNGVGCRATAHYGRWPQHVFRFKKLSGAQSGSDSCGTMA